MLDVLVLSVCPSHEGPRSSALRKVVAELRASAANPDRARFHALCGEARVHEPTLASEASVNTIELTTGKYFWN